MRDGAAPAAPRYRADSHPERSLNTVTFLGSFPNPDFRVAPGRPEVAFVGRSNVGKSSLINALTGRKAIARTSKTPGKTRDCNVYNVDDTLHLIDLPGYGYAHAARDERTRLGHLINDVLSSRPGLVGVVWLLDIRREPSDDDLRVAAQLFQRGIPLLLAITKGDKIAKSHRNTRAKELTQTLGLQPDQAIITSAKSKDGIDDLRDSIMALVQAH